MPPGSLLPPRSDGSPDRIDGRIERRVDDNAEARIVSLRVSLSLLANGRAPGPLLVGGIRSVQPADEPTEAITRRE
jgi:hypothetical protein